MTTNGLFVGRVLLENIRCMKWELQHEKRCKFCGCKQLKIYCRNLNFTLKLKNFLKESLIALYHFCSFTLDPLQSSRSLVLWIPSWNPNFTLRLKKLLEGNQFNCALSFQFSYVWSPLKLHILKVSDFFP